MSQYILKQFVKGIALQGESTDVTELVEGSLFNNSTEQRLKSFIEGQTRQLLTDTQVQDMSNKTHLGLFKVIDTGGTIHIGTSYLGDTQTTHVWSVFNDAGKVAQFGSWLASGNGGQTVFSGSRVNSTQVGNGVYTSGSVRVETNSSNFFQDAPNIAINSGTITIATAPAHVSGTYLNADSGNVLVQTGAAAGIGNRGDVTLDSRRNLLNAEWHNIEDSRDGLFATKNITFISRITRPELTPAISHRISTESVFDYNTQNTPSKSKDLSIASGEVTDSSLVAQKVDTGIITIATGDVNFGTGDSGSLILKTGNSQNENSGTLVIQTGEADNGNRGSILLDSQNINLNSNSVTSTSQLTFTGADETFIGVYTQGVDTTDYVSRGSPNKTAELHLVSGGVSDPTVGTDKVDSGQILLLSGPITTGTGDSGAISLTSGDSSNGDSGSIILKTGDSPNGTRGQVSILASSINVNSTSIQNVPDPISDQDAATKIYVDSELSLQDEDLRDYIDSELTSQDTNLRSYVDSQVATKADVNHTHDLTDINQSGATINQIPVWDGVAWTPTTVAGIGSLEFTDLSDVPTSYVGEAGKIVAVKATEDGLEFISGGAGETNTASNVGAGSGIYKEKVGVDLRLKSITQGAGITVTANADDIEIASSITQYTDSDARAAAVEDAIVDGILDKAPSQNAVFDALALKQNNLGFTAEDSANKSTDILLGTSDTLYPTQNAVKTYVDSAVSSVVVNDATSSTKGIVQLAGDLGGTASSPTVPALADKVESASNLGTGQGIFSSKVGTDLQLKSLIAGLNISLTPSSTGITIDNTFLESVNSVNTKTGVVVLDKTDIGLSNVDNTSDANKPISTATQTALNLKANTNLDNLISTAIPSGVSLNSLSIITTNDSTQFEVKTADQTTQVSGNTKLRSGAVNGNFASGAVRIESGNSTGSTAAGTRSGIAVLASGSVSVGTGGTNGSSGGITATSGTINSGITGNSGSATYRSGTIAAGATGSSGLALFQSGLVLGSGTSGQAAFFSGFSAAGGASGQVFLYSGKAQDQASGQVNIFSSPVNTDTAGGTTINNVTSTAATGNLNISSGEIANTASPSATGNVNINSGNHAGTGASGSVNIRTGNIAATGTGVSGNLNLNTGSVATGSASNSGNIVLSTGTVDTGIRGSIDLNTSKVNVNATLDLNNNDIVEVGVFYFGDPNTDGTWRIRPSAGNLVTELRQSGVWVVKQTITP